MSEKIILTDLLYNGGDGGYELQVFQEQNGKETELPMPESYVIEFGFPFHVKYDGEKMEIFAGEERIAEIGPEKLQEIYQMKGLGESLENAKGRPAEIAGDAVSGFTIVQEESAATPVLIVKSYLSGLGGHADCIGYGVAKLRLDQKNTWNATYHFLLDEAE